MAPAHVLVQRPGLARIAKAARLEHFFSAGIEEHEDRRIAGLRQLAELLGGEVVGGRLGLEDDEFLRIQVFQLSAGELAGDVPAEASARAGIEDQQMAAAALLDLALRLLEGIHGPRQAECMSEAAHRQEKSCGDDTLHKSDSVCEKC